MAADDVRTPNRRRIDWRGEYREVDPPERLVFTVTDRPGDDAFELVTVLAHRPRRRPHRDAVRTARLDVPGAIRARNRRLGTFFDRMQQRLAAG